MQTNPIIIADTETGGLEDSRPIIQLAAVAVHGAKIVDKFECKIKFKESDCDPEALKMNHYDPEKWINAVSPLEACRLFARFVVPYKYIPLVSAKGRPYKVARISGYNIVRFDLPKIQKMFADNDQFLPCNYISLDVLQLAVWYYQINPELMPENLKLGTVCQANGIEIGEAHDALEDSIATAMLAISLTGGKL